MQKLWEGCQTMLFQVLYICRALTHTQYGVPMLLDVLIWLPPIFYLTPGRGLCFLFQLLYICRALTRTQYTQGTHVSRRPIPRRPCFMTQSFIWLLAVLCFLVSAFVHFPRSDSPPAACDILISKWDKFSWNTISYTYCYVYDTDKDKYNFLHVLFGLSQRQRQWQRHRRIFTFMTKTKTPGDTIENWRNDLLQENHHAIINFIWTLL